MARTVITTQRLGVYRFLLDLISLHLGMCLSAAASENLKQKTLYNFHVLHQTTPRIDFCKLQLEINIGPYKEKGVSVWQWSIKWVVAQYHDV